MTIQFQGHIEKLEVGVITVRCEAARCEQLIIAASQEETARYYAGMPVMVTIQPLVASEQ